MWKDVQTLRSASVETRRCWNEFWGVEGERELVIRESGVGG